MIQLFRILIEDVGISLHGRYTGNFVNFVEHVGQWLEDRPRLRVFIAVSRNDDVRMGILIENLLDQCLW